MEKQTKIVVFDLDGTITRRDTYIPFLMGLALRKPWILLRLAGLPFAVCMHFASVRDNTWLKKKFLKAFMRGMDKSQFESWVEAFSDQIVSSEVRKAAWEEIEKHKSQHACVLLVSASLDIYVNRIGEKLGVHATLCTEVEWDAKGRLTGDLKTENCYGEEKILRLKSWLQTHGGSKVDIAYSDHHSDIPLLNYAGTGVAVSPSKKLADIIHSKQIKLVHW